MKEKKLIIQVNNSGLGDQLFHSHLPEIAKVHFDYTHVYISNFSNIKFPVYREFVWDLNPYIDGFIDDAGVGFDIANIINLVNAETNLLDLLMIKFGLDNGIRQNQPKIYYQPKIISKLKGKTIYDPNYLSWIGLVEPLDLTSYTKKNKIKFDYVMKLRGGNVLYQKKLDTSFYETPTLFDFCDLIYSVKKMYCLTSGTATIAAGLNVQCSVFYGKGQPIGFRHFQKHNYILIKRSIINRIRLKLVNIFKKNEI